MPEYKDLGLANNEIVSVQKTSGTGLPGSIDTYTITVRDGSTFTFNVTNGNNGVTNINRQKFTNIVTCQTFLAANKDNVACVIYCHENNDDELEYETINFHLGYDSGEQSDSIILRYLNTTGTWVTLESAFMNGEFLYVYYFENSEGSSVVPTSRTIAGISLESDITENALFDKMNIKGRYATLTALQTANPNHGYCYLVESNNHWYYHNGSAWSDGGLYQAAEIADGSVTLEKLGNDVIDTIKQFTGNKKFLDFENKFISTNVGIGNVVDINTTSGDNTWTHAIVECAGGDEFVITGAGGTGPRVATFTDSTYHALFISSGDMNNTKIVAPTNSSYLIFNSKKSVDYQVIKNIPLVDVVSNVNDDLDTTILEINNYRLLKEAKWQRGRIANGVFNPDVIYEISTANILHFNREVTLKIASGYEINVNYFNSDGTFNSQQNGVSRGEATFDHTQYFKITLRKTSYVTTEQANIELYSRNLLISTASNLEIWKKKYRYLVATFYGTTKDSIIFLGTNDLRSFDLLAKKGLYKVTNERSSGLTSSLRDPAIIQIGEWYYFTYSVGGVVYGDTDIGFCRTKDFVNWEELSNLSMSVDGYDTDAAWAPSWFRNGNELFVVVSLHIRNSRFCTAMAKYNVSAHQFSDSHVIMDNTGIDYHIYMENGKFYACGSGGRVCRATNIYGPYEVITNVEVTNEADFIVKLDSGKWRRYKQELSAYNDGRQLMIYQDADTLESEWGSEYYVQYTNTAKNYIQSLGANINSALYYHWTIFDFNNSNNNNNNFTYEV